MSERICEDAASAQGSAAPEDTRSRVRHGWQVWREDHWVKPFFGQYRKVLALSLALGVLTLAFAAALMFASGYLISDAAERPELGVFALLVPLGLVQIFGIGKPFLGYLERLTSHDWVLRMTSHLREHLYRSIERKGMFWSGVIRAGDALGLLSQDIAHVQDLYLRCVFPTIVAWVLWVLVVLVFGAFSPLFALLMLVSLGVLTVLMPLVSVLMNGARQLKAKQLSNQLYVQVYDGVTGLADWQFAQRYDEHIAHLMAVDGELDALEARSARFDHARDLVSQVLFGLLACVVLVWAALHFGAMAQDAAGSGVSGRPADWIAAFVLGLFPLMEAFSPLPTAAVQAGSHLDSVERLNALENAGAGGATGDEGGARNAGGVQARGVEAPGVGTAEAGAASSATPTEGDAGGAQERGTQAPGASEHPSERPAKGNAGEDASRTPVPQQFDIRFEDVVFSYPGEQRDVLRGLNLSIEPGQHVAVLGPSGSGKSTLVHLLRGDLAPTAGSVTLGGVPCAHLGEGAARYMGLIQQETYLFNLSLFENLRIGNPTATREQCAEALASVGLQPLLERLTEGLDTSVDEGGLRFSGGERHRIALARVLLQDTPVVLLDEPTVSLDPLTEAALLKTLLRVLKGRTVLMVTHHLLGIEHMDRVIFLEEGHVYLDGSPAHLEATEPRYRQLLALDRGL